MEIHRAHARMMWRGESRPPIAGHRLVARLITWHLCAIGLSVTQAYRFGERVEPAAGKSRRRQLWELMHLSLRYSIPPRAYYQLALYEPRNYPLAAEYLHRFETKGTLFRRLNELRGGDRAVLDDKCLFEKRCREAGLPTPPTLLEARAGVLSQREVPACSVVFKPIGGKGGKGIERWNFADGRYRMPGQPPATRGELSTHLRELSADRDYLVQPALENHPAIRDLGGDVFVTARVMTAQNEAGETEVLMGSFRTAVGNASVDNFHQGGIASAIDLATGILGPAIGLGVESPWHDVHPIHGSPISGRQLPEWSAVLDLARRAHDAVPELLLIGWDIGITPEGPVLIEGNSEPDVVILQRPHRRPLGRTRLAEIVAHHLRTAF